MAKEETKEELLARWNKPPRENQQAAVLGEQVPEGDTRATAHGAPDDANAHIAAGEAVRAQTAGGGGGPEAPESDDYNDWTVAQLKAEIDRRNEDRDPDDRLSKSGRHDDLVDRLEEDDDNEE